jgi:hypothetical protein
MNPTKQPLKVLVVDDSPNVSELAKDIAAHCVDRVVPIRGEFSLTIRDRSGKIVEEYVDKNLIVNGSKTALARLLDGSNNAKRVTKIAFGTNATAPDISDTTITGAVIKNLTGSTYPEFNSVQFSWVLDFLDAVGVNIAEFGLLCDDGSLFARKTRTAIAKTSDLQLQGAWKIVF